MTTPTVNNHSEHISPDIKKTELSIPSELPDPKVLRKLFGDSVEGESQEAQSQISADKTKEEEKLRKDIENAVSENMEKYRTAYNSTIAEVMGKPLPKKDEK